MSLSVYALLDGKGPSVLLLWTSVTHHHARMELPVPTCRHHTPVNALQDLQDRIAKMVGRSAVYSKLPQNHDLNESPFLTCYKYEHHIFLAHKCSNLERVDFVHVVHVSCIFYVQFYNFRYKLKYPCSKFINIPLYL